MSHIIPLLGTISTLSILLFSISVHGLWWQTCYRMLVRCFSESASGEAQHSLEKEGKDQWKADGREGTCTCQGGHRASLAVPTVSCLAKANAIHACRVAKPARGATSGRRIPFTSFSCPCDALLGQDQEEFGGEGHGLVEGFNDVRLGLGRWRAQAPRKWIGHKSGSGDVVEDHSEREGVAPRNEARFGKIIPVQSLRRRVTAPGGCLTRVCRRTVGEASVSWTCNTSCSTSSNTSCNTPEPLSMRPYKRRHCWHSIKSPFRLPGAVTMQKSA